MKENKERILLGVVEVPENARKWMKFVTQEGEVYAQPLNRKGRKCSEDTPKRI